jgi:hypothetical protein
MQSTSRAPPGNLPIPSPFRSSNSHVSQDPDGSVTTQTLC